MLKNKCRIDGSELSHIFNLGEMYISDFISDDKIYDKKKKYPLDLYIGKGSDVLQLNFTTDPDLMYRKYWYKSGTNQTMRTELKSIAKSAIKLGNLSRGDVILDIGCNDGTLLSNIDNKVIKIGIDPASNGYRDISKQHAHYIIEDYFSSDIYNGIMKKRAKVITSIAMFYDLDNPNKFVEDIYNVLDDDGLWICQMSYTPLMIKQLAFDNIVHEHIFYYTLNSFEHLIERHGLSVVDCQLNDVNGGSFRLYIKKTHNVDKFATQPYRDISEFRIQSTRLMEKMMKLQFDDGLDIYKNFINSVESMKRKTYKFIEDQKNDGKTIWGYGASTKGNTLLQYFNLDNTIIDGIAERSPSKYGLKTIGTNIPIYPEEEMRKQNPDYLLILPWHFIREFTDREKWYLNNGGKFIVPCPQFEIIGKDFNHVV